MAAVLKPEAAAAGQHEAYLICAPDSRYAEPTLPLLASVLDITNPILRTPMAGNASPLSAAKAEARLGFKPRSWQDGRADRDKTDLACDLTAGRAESSSRGSAAARRALRDGMLQRFPLEGFVLQCGAILPPSAALAYKVHVDRPMPWARTSISGGHNVCECTLVCSRIAHLSVCGMP